MFDVRESYIIIEALGVCFCDNFIYVYPIELVFTGSHLNMGKEFLVLLKVNGENTNSISNGLKYHSLNDCIGVLEEENTKGELYILYKGIKREREIEMEQKKDRMREG